MHDVLTIARRTPIAQPGPAGPWDRPAEITARLDGVGPLPAAFTREWSRGSEAEVSLRRLFTSPGVSSRYGANATSFDGATDVVSHGVLVP